MWYYTSMFFEIVDLKIPLPRGMRALARGRV
jgi:hypothetical protein